MEQKGEKRVKGANILCGVTGSIALYRACELIRALKKESHHVKVVPTKSALEFVTSLTFESLSDGCYTDRDVAKSPFLHIDLGSWSDLLLVAPATANTLAKFNSGVCDNLLTQIFLRFRGPVVVAPAMNGKMFTHPITQRNLNSLRMILGDNFVVVGPDSGPLACGEDDTGRLSDINDILAAVNFALYPKPLKNKRVVVTAGPTREFIDPVRFISNRSSGRMGFFIAEVARYLGADVTLISGPVDIRPPWGVDYKTITTADELKERLFSISDIDILIMCAAVADFRPKQRLHSKIPKESLQGPLELEANPDILAEFTRLYKKTFVVGFSAQTEDIIKNGMAKLNKKDVDLLVATDVSSNKHGFGSDRIRAAILCRDGIIKDLQLWDKKELAEVLLYEVSNRRGN